MLWDFYPFHQSYLTDPEDIITLGLVKQLGALFASIDTQV